MRPVPQKIARFQEIDFIRGIGIIVMVIFHFGYDLVLLGLATFEIWDGPWLLMARMVQFIFILTTGTTLAISYGKKTMIRIQHALKLFTWGIVITGITWILFDQNFVKFGILHFYGVAIILAHPLLRFKTWNTLIGGLILIISPWVLNLPATNSWLFPLGITPPHFNSLDYFPLFPWFGLFLLGTAWGSWFYQNNQRQGNIMIKIPASLKIIEKIGSKSLIIYLLHQPFLFAILKGIDVAINA